MRGGHQVRSGFLTTHMREIQWADEIHGWPEIVREKSISLKLFNDVLGKSLRAQIW